MNSLLRTHVRQSGWRVACLRLRCLIAVVGLIGSASLVMTVAPVSHADSTPITIPWPGVPMPPARIGVHGDGSVTVSSNDTGNYYNYPGSTVSLATLSPAYDSTDIVAKTTDSWTILPDQAHQVVGSDKTTYMTQRNDSTGAQRIAARRGAAMLWSSSFATRCSGHQIPNILSIVSSYDGDLFAEVSWPAYSSGCPSSSELAGIASTTGRIKFETASPLPQANNLTYGGSNILPYEGGTALVNGGSVYYYSDGGLMDTSNTFTPTVPPNTSIGVASMAADGRVYLETNLYTSAGFIWHVLGKSPGNSAVTDLSLPSGSSLYPQMAVTVDGGVVICWLVAGSYYFGYFGNDGTQVYAKSLSYESNQSLVGSSFGIGVDDLGDVIVQRTMDNGSERNVYVDSFSAGGLEAHLFNSATQFGSPGFDLFTSSAWSPQAIGDKKFYLTLCHVTTAPNGSWPTTCASNASPEIVVVPIAGSFDYPRSEIYAAARLKENYVALGDSYSSGEGNPPFIVPTDNDGGDGCDRSYVAYPVAVATANFMNLRAFVACSGATSGTIIGGQNGEPGQIESLDVNTDIVTVIAGGNDVRFADFAAECVIGTCDAASSQYLDTMDQIDNYLQANLKYSSMIYDWRRRTRPFTYLVIRRWHRRVAQAVPSCQMVRKWPPMALSLASTTSPVQP